MSEQEKNKMYIKHYYIFEKLTKSKQRRDCIKSSKLTHPLIELNCLNKVKFNIGGLRVNVGTKPGNQEDNGTTMTIKYGNGEHMSSLYFSDPVLQMGWGDIQGTNDTFLFLTDPGLIRVEMFIAPNTKNSRRNIYNLFEKGDLKFELQWHRENSVHRFNG